MSEITEALRIEADVRNELAERMDQFGQDEDLQSRRRLQRVMLPIDKLCWLIAWFLRIGGTPSMVIIPEFAPPFQPDTEVYDVHYDFQTDCYGFVVHSRTFDVVPEGNVIPIRPLTIREAGQP